MSGIIKDSVIYGISTLFQRGVQILLTPLYFATLADGQTGLLDILVGFSLISVCIFSLNITNGMAREMADGSSPIKDTHTASALWFSLFTCFFGALCIVVFPSCSRFLFSG